MSDTKAKPKNPFKYKVNPLPNANKAKIELMQLLEEKEARVKQNKIASLFPEKGTLRRELYRKHMEFFKAGPKYKQRLFLAANRVGKSMAGAYEIVCHLTGVYPEWWTGHKFEHAPKIWAVGKSSKQMRDSIQEILLGPASDQGTGLIPKDKIMKTYKASGISEYYDMIAVKHSSNEQAVIQLKSTDQGREAFQGGTIDCVWIDEETSQGVYEELIIRTMTTNGIIILTMTPLMGMTPLIQSFLENADDKDKIVISATWDDVPHLTEAMKNALWSSLPPHQREARSKGVPQLGAGAIYPVGESEFVIPSFEIPKHWPRMFALDVGWNNTAASWLAIDPDTQVGYLYSDYKQGGEQPLYHAEAIKARGKWIPGVIDPASRGRSQSDGQRLCDQYTGHGLTLSFANNAVAAGIYAVWEALSTGKLKVFSHCVKFLEEYRLYHRDERGNIVKTNDHIMDTVRYAWMTRDKAEVELKQSIMDTSDFYRVNQTSRITL